MPLSQSNILNKDYAFKDSFARAHKQMTRLLPDILWKCKLEANFNVEVISDIQWSRQANESSAIQNWMKAIGPR